MSTTLRKIILLTILSTTLVSCNSSSSNGGEVALHDATNNHYDYKIGLSETIPFLFFDFYYEFNVSDAVIEQLYNLETLNTKIVTSNSSSLNSFSFSGVITSFNITCISAFAGTADIEAIIFELDDNLSFKMTCDISFEFNSSYGDSIKLNNHREPGQLGADSLLYHHTYINDVYYDFFFGTTNMEVVSISTDSDIIQLDNLEVATIPEDWKYNGTKTSYNDLQFNEFTKQTNDFVVRFHLERTVSGLSYVGVDVDFEILINGDTFIVPLRVFSLTESDELSF